MAMTACSAKVSINLIYAGVKARASVRRAASVPMNSPCCRSGTTNNVRVLPEEPSIGNSVCARASGRWSAPCSRTRRIQGSSISNSSTPNGYGYRTKVSTENHCVPLAESQHCVIDPTNPCCALDDGIEDRLHVRRRATDDAEYLRRSCLMLKRFAQF